MKVKKLKSFINKALYTGEKAFDRLLDKHVTLGITGLSGSGKSTFITSLIYQLIHHQTATLPSFSPVNQGRFLGCKIRDMHRSDIKPFDYQSGMEALSAGHPDWPVSTMDLSSILLEIRYRPRPSLLPGRKYNRLFLEIRDYPGEWLLDLPMLSQSYFEWSMECAHLFQQQPRKDLLGNLQPLLDSINPVSTVDPAKVQQVQAEFVAFLNRCKGHGLSLIQPGRFLLPNRDGQAVTAFFPLIMATAYKEDVLVKSRPDSFYAVMKRAYDDYLKQQVKPFYKDYFSGIDRQLILVDVLKALNAGKHNMEDLAVAMSRILDSFHYGDNNILTRLFSPRISKVVLAASKIDQVLPDQHENIRALTSSLIQDVQRQANYEQVDVFNEAVAAVRCTETVYRSEQAFLQGVTDEGDAGLLRHPPIPDQLPSEAQWLEYSGWHLRKLQPPLNPGLKQGGKLPHVRMDTVIRELIGDKF